jgi:AraC-like DNA-binding protein
MGGIAAVFAAAAADEGAGPGPPVQEVHTTDLDQIRESVARLIKPHSIRPAGRFQPIDGHHRAFEVGTLGLIQLRYGAVVDIDPGPMDPWALVQVPLSGSSPITVGSQSIVSTPSLASVVTAHLPSRLSYSADCEQLILRLSPAALARQCAQMIGRELAKPLEFDLGLPLDGDGGQGFLRLMSYLRQEAEQPNSLLRAPLAAAQFEQMLMTTLLLVQNHSYAEALHQPQAAAAPFYVKRAEAYIEEHLDEPLSVGELAAAVGVSARSLYDGFQRFRDTTPMAHVKTVRLQRAHQDLLTASVTGVSVTDVAMRWGFGNLGHFAVAYKERFGESPRDTLRRSR